MTLNFKEKIAIRTDPQKYSEQLGYINADFRKKIYADLADEAPANYMFLPYRERISFVLGSRVC